MVLRCGAQAKRSAMVAGGGRGRGQQGAAGTGGFDEAKRSRIIEADNMGVVFSGRVWERPPRARAQIVRRVCETLERAHGTPRLGNPENPLDDLIYIILSNKTTPAVAETTYNGLKRDFPTWDGLRRECTVSQLATRLRRAGLGRVKAEQLLGILRTVAADYGSCTLDPLEHFSEEEAQRYLTSLPGVSEKVAKCVIMYTLDAKVLPVDSHVHRVARRLGWTERKRADQCHGELEALVPAHRRFPLHVDCVVHGRTVCRPFSPRCQACGISRYCDYYLEKTDGCRS